MTWEEFLQTPGKPYPCFNCMAEFDSQEEKDQHIINEHDYIKLDTALVK
jgi:hypothetical protein